MRMKTMLAALPLALSLTLPSGAASAAVECDIAAPIIELMPALESLGSALNLSAEQSTKIRGWVAEHRPARQSAEQTVRDARAALRDAILNGEPQPRIPQLTELVAQRDRILLEIRNEGALMLRNVLNKEQYERVVQRYREGI
jgi:hypothetical protein